MSEPFRLLIVEDDDGQYEAYSDAVDEISGENLSFEITRKKTALEAKSELTSKEFDGAIVDLNLDSSNPTEATGNEVLLEIMNSHRFPVFVVSGNLGHLDPAIRDNISDFLKCYDRDKSNDEIFSELKGIYDTGITHILGGRGLIDKKLGEIFWNHLSNDMDIWLQKKDGIGNALLRYTVSHLTEYLDIPTGDDRYYFEPEFYIKPPIREYIATGDIVQKEDERYIVLSPSCDVAVRGIDNQEVPIINADMVTLAKLLKVDRNIFIENKIINEGDNSGARENILKRIISGQWDKYVFIPEYKELYAAVIDLQNLYTINFSNYLAEYNRIATISNSFLKDIQSRFASYYGRQGQPDLDKSGLIKKHKSELNP